MINVLDVGELTAAFIAFASAVGILLLTRYLDKKEENKRLRQEVFHCAYGIRSWREVESLAIRAGMSEQEIRQVDRFAVRLHGEKNLPVRFRKLDGDTDQRLDQIIDEALAVCYIDRNCIKYLRDKKPNQFSKK